MDEAGEDPQGGLSAHLYNLEADGEAFPDQPAEGGDFESSADGAITGEQLPGDVTVATEPVETSLGETRLGEVPTEPSPGSDQDGALLSEPTTAPVGATPRYQGEGVYVGSEPPEGFTIKGNERSMKYHLPESAGYGRTVAEVWFNSEEAAQQAGFVRAQR
jgi:hypothetical protein